MDPVTIEGVLSQLRDFLVLWITQILYHNRIYSENAFEEKTYLDLIVHQSRVPDLNVFFKNFANEMVSVLVKKAGGGKVHDVIVLLYNETNSHVTRRYIINFSQFVGLADQVSSLDFLSKSTDSQLSRLDLPEMTWGNIYTYLRSMMFFHIEELRRTQQAKDNCIFFKLLLNMDDSANLSSENAKWVKLTSEQSRAKTKFVSLGEMSVGFLCFDLHNEYIL
ncbi:DNA-binding protein [Metschnikowia bicuspidata var. bicuspidata NRRL YB-4993]|uniref:DNA-binding protein n=1 Tax=Metschnikowia bicuspidata var. bicuspidata NRRL YB-4993 TaxID=869754 RepID=A0A1A0H712_9ASCO|nr:DNA-binding protein [Metschnikowia bicuspidata var. bicuspidata NRRL YB-4993]OBA19889.1 DNA-binding protein [Metschnikowia bicuspidata var. bicuspidata NRRL YB-4993]